MAKEPRNTLAMTIKVGAGYSVEVHVLNPGECVERFGGSKHALFAGKTASLVTREKSVGMTDVERDIYDPLFWDWIARLINGDVKEAKAEVPAKAA